jgi:hypothetical protein
MKTEILWQWFAKRKNAVKYFEVFVHMLEAAQN